MICASSASSVVARRWGGGGRGAGERTDCRKTSQTVRTSHTHPRDTGRPRTGQEHAILLGGGATVLAGGIPGAIVQPDGCFRLLVLCTVRMGKGPQTRSRNVRLGSHQGCVCVNAPADDRARFFRNPGAGGTDVSLPFDLAMAADRSKTSFHHSANSSRWARSVTATDIRTTGTRAAHQAIGVRSGNGQPCLSTYHRGAPSRQDRGSAQTGSAPRARMPWMLPWAPPLRRRRPLPSGSSRASPARQTCRRSRLACVRRRCVRTPSREPCRARAGAGAHRSIRRSFLPCQASLVGPGWTQWPPMVSVQVSSRDRGGSGGQSVQMLSVLVVKVLLSVGVQTCRCAHDADHLRRIAVLRERKAGTARQRWRSLTGREKRREVLSPARPHHCLVVGTSSLRPLAVVDHHAAELLLLRPRRVPHLRVGTVRLARTGLDGS